MVERTLKVALFAISLTLIFQGLVVTPSIASVRVKVDAPCKKGSKNVVQKDFLFRCQKQGKTWAWSSTPLNTSSQVTPAKAQLPNIPATPLELPTGTDPHLVCDGSGETSGLHPGWSSQAAVQLTSVPLSGSDFGLYWCPAAAIAGAGVISYTVTSTLGAQTCETVHTSCVMRGLSQQTPFQIMATDGTGSYGSSTLAIQNTGTPSLCVTEINFCNPGPGSLTFPSYGNVAPIGIGDCTFAAVANWEEIILGTVPDQALILSEFAQAGGTPNLGLTNSQVFDYWASHGIGGTLLNAALPFYADPVHLMNAIDDKNVRAVIASLNLVKGQNFAGTTMPDSSYHWVVVDGYTPQGPLVATWGKTLQMTWQQWNLEIVSMWGITTRFEVPLAIQ